jgi:hypothetical protein
VDRIKYWLGVGALPSKSALKLLQMVRRFHAFVGVVTDLAQGRIVPSLSDKTAVPQQLTATSSETGQYPTSNHPPTESRPPTLI